MSFSGRILWAIRLMFLGLAVGCGGVDAVPDLAVVSGIVKFQGQPLENAVIVFLPETPGARSANGITDKTGRYQLTTDLPNDGAIVGRHRVSITARGPDKKLPDDPLSNAVIGGLTAPGDPLIPTKYFGFETSGLAAEVKPGKNSHDFNLTK